MIYKLFKGDFREYLLLSLVTIALIFANYMGFTQRALAKDAIIIAQADSSEMIESEEIEIRAKPLGHPSNDDINFDPFALPSSPSKELIAKKNSLEKAKERYQESIRKIEIIISDFEEDMDSKEIKYLIKQREMLQEAMAIMVEKLAEVEELEQAYLEEISEFEDQKWDYLPDE